MREERAPSDRLSDRPLPPSRHVPSLPQFLPVAAHDEQAVVDGQPEAEGGRQVEGVDRDGHERRSTTRSTARVPTIAIPPTANGSNAATTLPKTNTRATRVRGMATDSASEGSWEILLADLVVGHG